MKVHPVELELARAYDQELAFERLSPEQILLIRNRGRDLHRWYKAHPAIHALINTSLILWIFAVDWLLLTQLPGLFQHSGHSLHASGHFLPPENPVIAVWCFAGAPSLLDRIKHSF